MDCPFCSKYLGEFYECADELKHWTFCKYAPGACLGCSRRKEVIYEDGHEHGPSCLLAKGACIRCGRRPSVQYSDKHEHDEFCIYRTGCIGCSRYEIESNHSDTCRMEKYTNAVKYKNYNPNVDVTCPSCELNDGVLIVYSDGLLHGNYCRYAPGACLICRRIDGVKYIDGYRHEIGCPLAEGACIYCHRRLEVEYEDGLEHDVKCRLAPGACVGCHRRERIEYEDERRHDEECEIEKYKNAVKRAKKHKETMKLLSRSNKKDPKWEKKDPKWDKKEKDKNTKREKNREKENPK